MCSWFSATRSTLSKAPTRSTRRALPGNHSLYPVLSLNPPPLMGSWVIAVKAHLYVFQPGRL